MNTTARIGKIARLPHNLREQLNLKLHDGLPAKSILPWLNSLPEVKTILAVGFENRPISKQNLSEWKHGGFRDWLLQYHAAHFLQFFDPCSSRREEAQIPPSELSASSDHPNAPVTQHTIRNTQHTSPHGIHGTADTHDIPLVHKLLLWTQLQYTAMARYIDAETDPERKWNSLRQFATDISRLRRSTVADDYLQIQRDWLALSQSNSTEKKELEFCKWIKRPDIADAIKNKRRGMTKELFRKIEEENLYLMGPPNPSLDEHIAQVRLAKELMARRKAKEADANKEGSAARAASSDANPSEPSDPPPHIRLHGMPFEELFPTIPDKRLTLAEGVGRGVPTAPHDATAPSEPLARPRSSQSNPPDQSEQSSPVQPSQTESNQIQPSPLHAEPNPNNDNATPDI
jgi:hypothetical protein